MQPSSALCAALVAFFGLSPALALPANVDARNVIVRDVAIIGGGSSGINAAIKLKDAGKSVIVVEAKSNAGGHADTYTDPASGYPIDYGVVIFHNTSTVRNYFSRFNIPLVVSDILGGKTLPLNFDTGAIVNVPASEVPTEAAYAAAYQKYIAFLSKYPQLEAGMFLPKPVPQELAIPIAQLASELGFEAIMSTLAGLNPATGNLTSLPVAEFTRVAGLGLIQQIINSSFLTSGRHNTSELYAKAQAELAYAQSILLSSRVVSSQRKDNGVELVVKTPQGTKYICAKKLIIAIPPLLSNLKVFNPTQNEQSVFSKWLNAGYYTSIVKNTGLPATESVINTNLANPFGLPNEPGIVNANPTGVSGLSTVYYATARGNAEYPLSNDVVKSRILAQIQRAQSVNQKTANFTQTTPEIVAFDDHSPFNLQVTSKDILAGFYENMNALQGQKSTFYTGAAWSGQDSSKIWYFNEQVLVPEVLKSL